MIYLIDTIVGAIAVMLILLIILVGRYYRTTIPREVRKILNIKLMMSLNEFWRITELLLGIKDILGNDRFSALDKVTVMVKRPYYAFKNNPNNIKQYKDMHEYKSCEE